MKIKTIHVIAIGLAILLLAYTGYITIPGITPEGGDTTQTSTSTGGTSTTPLSVSRAANAKWRIRDALTKTDTAASDTAYVSIIKADADGYFDALNPVEETEFDASPDTSSATYSSGDDLIIAVTSDNDPTGGAETYPRWFYIKDLEHGAAIRSLKVTNPISAISQFKSGSTYKFSIVESQLGETVGTVSWVEGTSPYWDFGVFEVYGRVAKDYLLFQTTYSGTVGASITDGATWVDTDAEITANFTLTGDTETMYAELIGEQNDVAYGLPTLAVSSNGQIVQYNAVLIFATDATGVDPVDLQDDGWKPISKPDLTNDVAYYYVIDPADGGIPDTGDRIDISVPITIDDAALASSTEYEFELWVLDWQNLDNVQIGATTTSLPTVNGFLSDMGCDTVVMPRALTVSSGSAATPQLMGHFTTN